MSCSSMASLDSDIVACIFQLVCAGSTYDDYWPYIRARSILCSVCRGWFLFIRNTEAFWRLILCDQSVPLESVFLSLSRTPSCSLDIIMSFRQLEDRSQAFVYINRFMLESASSVPRWRSLRVETDDSSVLVHIHLSLRDQSAPLLRTLSVSSHHDPRHHARLRHSPTLSWFSARLPNLVHLRLYGADMPAASLNSLPSLRKLSIQRMDGHIRPLSIEDLTTVLSAIPRIEDLHIGHIRCSDSRYPEPPNSIMLPDLLRLRLSFGIPDSIHLLVPLIAAPRLRRLSLRITNSGHVIAAARCADKFSSVRRVVICGRVDAGGISLWRTRRIGCGVKEACCERPHHVRS
ncbi:hypothetical protein C8J57DRAFT_1303538 [Mycena rebaudengoi]|nr:hypothetical protein C8J57DRAFT_1321350 [Mycena rebaudengoi]KAJ7279525.1 hypothetical protein C8J57DRAFT_1303538 [Mycena rebaudengoi]